MRELPRPASKRFKGAEMDSSAVRVLEVDSRPGIRDCNPGDTRAGCRNDVRGDFPVL